MLLQYLVRQQGSCAEPEAEIEREPQGFFSLTYNPLPHCFLSHARNLASVLIQQYRQSKRDRRA